MPLCYFLIEGRKDPARLGMLYLCTFTLLKLSGERNFGVALNKPYEVRNFLFYYLVLMRFSCIYL